MQSKDPDENHLRELRVRFKEQITNLEVSGTLRCGMPEEQ